MGFLSVGRIPIEVRQGRGRGVFDVEPAVGVLASGCCDADYYARPRGGGGDVNWVPFGAHEVAGELDGCAQVGVPHYLVVSVVKRCRDLPGARDAKDAVGANIDSDRHWPGRRRGGEDAVNLEARGDAVRRGWAPFNPRRIVVKVERYVFASSSGQEPPPAGFAFEGDGFDEVVDAARLG